MMNKKALADKISKVLKRRLAKTKSCSFKESWIPRGWSCVKDKIFTKEATAEIIIELFGKK